MFSKKEDFTNTIQYKLGLRFDDLHANSYQNINELAEIFIQKDIKAKWKTLNFLQTYYEHKKFLEEMTQQSFNSESNLNDLLNKEQKKKYIDFIKKDDINPIELFRPDSMNNILAWFPIFGILAPMLISTYLITKNDWSGWIYLSGLAGLLIWLILIYITKPFKQHFSPATFLDYIKSTYVIRHKALSKKEVSHQLVKQFIHDELQLIFNQSYSFDQTIPND